MTGRVRRGGLPVIVVLAAALFGCDSTKDAAAPPLADSATATRPASTTSTPAASRQASSAPAPTASTAPPTPLAQAPLTGASIAAGSRNRPAVAVTLRATTGPQETSGLPAADVVYEEFPASGRSRQIAVFQSRDPAAVGPVGATMPLDRKVGVVLGGVFAFSGGTAKFVKMVQNPPMVTVNALVEPAGFSRRGTDSYAELSRLRAAFPKATAPKAVLPFAETAGPAAAAVPTKAVAATISLTNGVRQEWTHTTDRLWRRTVGGKVLRTADGSSIAVANLIVQFTPYTRAYLKSSTGATVPTADVIGGGTATVCAAKGCLAGTWQRRGIAASSNYFDSRRSAIRLSRGSTWVVFAPSSSSLTLR